MAFAIRRGVNVGGWISQSKRRGQERRDWFTQRDVAKLRGWGFDHVRLPIDEEQFWDESGRHDPEAWDLLNSALDWCDQADMPVVVDLHIVRSHFFNAPQRPLFTDPAAAERFGQLWSDLSATLRGRSISKVAYELLNEAVADDPADWNRVYPYAYRAIRQREPDRTIVLGSNLWNQAYQFEFLDVPADDRHLILTFHYYYPMHVTHYRAAFVKECSAYQGPCCYPGMPIPQQEFNALAPDVQKLVAKWNKHYDRQVMKADLLWPLAVAARTGLPLYCGEFGVIRNAPLEIRQAWHRDTITLLEEHGIAWALWSYRGWGPFDRDGTMDEWSFRF